MYISCLTIKNYKSISPEGITLTFDKGINLIIGKNNSGKTTILESLRLSSPFMLFRRMMEPSFVYPELEVLEYINPKNLNLYQSFGLNYFEFCIEMRGFNEIDEVQHEWLKINNVIECGELGFLKYTIRYYPNEQYYERNCYLVNLETDKIKVEVIDEKKVIRERKIDQSIEEFDYNKYLPLNDLRDVMPEVHLLNNIRDFFYNGFIPSSGKISGNHYHKHEFDEFDEDFMGSVEQAVKHKETLKIPGNEGSEWGLINKKRVEDFEKFSKQIIGEEKFRFVSTQHDWQKQRYPGVKDGNSEEQDDNPQRLVCYFYKEGTPGYGIEYNSLGEGIRRALKLFWQLKITEYLPEKTGAPTGVPFVFIDEIESNMHPKLLSEIYKEVKQHAERRQFIITTHSNFFIDKSVIENSKIYRMSRSEDLSTKKDEIVDLDSLRYSLDSLGYKASNLLQPNGIIWVEGPSDIIYIECFIKLYCEKNGLDPLQKGVHYDFLMYGGSILSHYKVDLFKCDDISEILINIVNYQSNFFIVFDRDKYIDNCFNVGAEKKKERVINEIKDPNKWWMTQGQYIEEYLSGNDLVSIKNVDAKIQDKVKKAVEYAKKSYEYWFRIDTNLEEQIRKLVDQILKWNS